MRTIIGALLGSILIFALGFLSGVRYQESRREVVYDTTYVRTPPRVIVIEPDRVTFSDPDTLIFPDISWQTKIDTVLAECAGDSMKVRSYETEIQDSLLSGTLYSDVFGILLENRLEYSLNVPHITKTVYRTPVRGLIGAEASYQKGDKNFAILGGIRFSRQSILVRGDPFREEIGISVVRTF